MNKSNSDDELKDWFGQKNPEDQFPYDKENWKAMDDFLNKEDRAEDELSAFFKTRHKEDAYAYNEGNWMQMEKLLQKEKRRRLLLYFLLAGLLLGTLSLPLIDFTEHSDKKTLSQQSSAHAGNKEDRPKTDGKEQALKNNPSKPGSGKPEKEHPVKENVPTKMPLTEKTGKTESQHPQDVATDPQKNNPDIKETKQEDQPPTIFPERLTNTNKGRGDSSGLPYLSTVPAQDSGRVEQIPATTSDNNPRSALHERDSLHSEKQSDVTVSFSSPDSALEEGPVQPVLTPAKPDSILTASSLPADSLAQRPCPERLVFFELGGAYLMGWSTSSGKEAQGINPFVGLHYFYAINKKLGLSAGIAYSSVYQLKNTSHTSITSQLKFGEEANITVISANNLHYIYLPLKLTYLINTKNSLSCGYNFGYLLNANSTVETYQTRPGYSSTPQLSKAWGYTKGFNPFDGQVALCYRRHLYRLFHLNAEVFYGLQDIKKNAAYKSERFERNTGVKLSLIMNLWTNTTK